MTALYNEIEPYAARWLGNLINAGHIAKGENGALDVDRALTGKEAP